MKPYALILSLLCIAPSIALAQQPPPQQGGGPMDAPMMNRADAQKMRDAREAFRKQVLGALTPANRDLLAKVSGQLAASDQPDYKAAAEQLDAALSAGEKQAIVDDAKQFRDQMRAQWQSVHPGASPRPMRPRSNNAKREPDPGRILLSLDGHGMMGGAPQHR